jgi:hypothetical protein
MIPERAEKKRKGTRTSAQVLYLHINNLTSSAVIKIFFPIRKTLKYFSNSENNTMKNN